MKALVEISKPLLGVIQDYDGGIVHVLCTHMAGGVSWNKRETLHLMIQDQLMSEIDIDRMREDGFTLLERIESWLEANSYTFRIIEDEEIVTR